MDTQTAVDEPDVDGPQGSPEILVSVNGLPIASESTVWFNTATRQPVRKTVSVTNHGNAPLGITSIHWSLDSRGQPWKNPYVDLSMGDVQFPVLVENDGTAAFEFSVIFTPPATGTLDDLSPSMLAIDSDALVEFLGALAPVDFRIYFNVVDGVAAPRVTPSSYNYRNAEVGRPEIQELRIYNDPVLGTAPFQITDVALESPSSEFTLSDVPRPGTTVLEPGNPAYRDIAFKVTYAPTDDTPDANALVIETDAEGEVALRVPLSRITLTGDYTLSYSHVDAFDFGAASEPETRSVLVTCIGPGPITMREPRVEPPEAGQTFALSTWVPSGQAGGPDTEVFAWPRGIAVGKSIRLAVTYTPTGGPNAAMLVVPIEAPQPDHIEMRLVARL